MTSLDQHRADSVDEVVIPTRSIRQSERPLVKAGIWVFGYDRLLRWFKLSKSLKARSALLLSSGARRVLQRRTELIAALEEPAGASAGSASADRLPSRPLSDLKVALLIPSFQMAKGGAEKVAGRLATTLADAGCAVHIFCRPPTAAGPAYTVDPRVAIVNGIEVDDKHVAQLARHRFDLLIGFGMPGFYARIPEIARLLDVPFVIQECNNPDYMARSLKGTHLCRSNREAYWLRQAVFAHAAAVRMTVPDYAGSVVPDIRPFVHAFYNGLASVCTPADAPAKKMICVGAMKNETKNGLAAVRAFCAFSENHPDWSLHLYGENNRRAEMLRLMEKHPDSSIVDHGIVNDLNAIYKDAHALLIPSYDEGLPNVVVEALSYGVPCVGYADCSGVSHLIRDGETGLLLDRTEPRALEKALETIADPDLRARLSHNAARFAHANLEPATWEKNWLEVVRNAANACDAGGTPQRPAAENLADPRSSLWRELLGTYLYFPS